LIAGAFFDSEAITINHLSTREKKRKKQKKRKMQKKRQKEKQSKGKFN